MFVGFVLWNPTKGIVSVGLHKRYCVCGIPQKKLSVGLHYSIKIDRLFTNNEDTQVFVRLAKLKQRLVRVCVCVFCGHYYGRILEK